MQYVHIRSLEEYHPGYKDRKLQWAKFYFAMVQGDPEFELIESEIDKWRYISMICLELQAQKPLPISDTYFRRKGFDLRKRSMSLTLKMLHNFITVVTDDSEVCTLDKEKEEDKEKIKSKSKNATLKCGEYKNVILTSDQNTNLVHKFGMLNLQEKIKNLDEYIETSGKKYKNHYLVILQWDRRDKKKNPKQKEFIGYLYECPECKENFILDDENINWKECPECPKTERKNGMIMSDELEYIMPFYDYFYEE